MGERKVVAEKEILFPDPIAAMLAAVFMILGIRTGSWTLFLITGIMALISALIPLSVRIRIILEKKGE